MRRAAIAALLLLGGLNVAHAQDDQVDCNNAQTQADMTNCAGQDFEKADKELNAVYKEAMASQVALDKQSAEISPDYVGAVKALKKAQRAWIDYRDGECEGVSYQAAGGTMQPMLELGCKADLTNKRIKELKELIQGAGN
jgi:uncharacterized protein YecT (DUF1311 family)